ncbi:MAG: CDP-diacylglycerol--glycerol-3-phosphate 3-phosphatidyltransferase [Waddliaceae bacterium]
MNIANYFTIFRIFISPIFLLIYLEHETIGISSQTLPYILLTLLIISETSDAVDGYLARKLEQVTDLGKVLDPMADSIYRISIFLTFTLKPVQLPMLLIFAFIYRDSVISTLRTICAMKGFVLAARKSGKIKAVIQATAAIIVTILLIPHSLGMITTKTLQVTSGWVVGVAAIYTLASGIEYLMANRSYISRALRPIVKE